MQLTALVIVQQHFSRQRALAVGIASAGAGLGSFMWPALTRMLLNEYGLRGTILLMGGIFLHAVPFAALYIPPSKKNGAAVSEIPKIVEENGGIKNKNNKHLTDTSSLYFGSTLSMPTLYQQKPQDIVVSSPTEGEVEAQDFMSTGFLNRKQYNRIMLMSGHSHGCIHDTCQRMLQTKPIVAKTFDKQGPSVCGVGNINVLTASMPNVARVDLASPVSPSSCISNSSMCLEWTDAEKETRKQHLLSVNEIETDTEIKASPENSNQNKDENVDTDKADNVDSDCLNLNHEGSGSQLINKNYNNNTKNISKDSIQTEAKLADVFFDRIDNKQKTFSVDEKCMSSCCVNSRDTTGKLSHEMCVDHHHICHAYSARKECIVMTKVMHAVSSLLGLTLLGQWRMWLLLIGFFFQTLGMLTPTFFLPVKLLSDDGMGENFIDSRSVVMLVSIVGITDTVGRLLFGAVGSAAGDHVSPLVMFSLLSALAGGSSIVSTALGISTFPTLAVYTAMYGIFLGEEMYNVV